MYAHTHEHFGNNTSDHYIGGGINLCSHIYSFTEVESRADPVLQAVKLQGNTCIPNSRLPLLSITPVVTFPAAYCTVFDEQKHVCVCEQLAQSCYMAANQSGVELTTS